MGRNDMMSGILKNIFKSKDFSKEERRKIVRAARQGKCGKTMVTVDFRCWVNMDLLFYSF